MTHIEFKRKRIARIIVNYVNGNSGSGTGFFISSAGKLLTCFHVAFSDNFEAIKNSAVFAAGEGDEKTKLRHYFDTLIGPIYAEFPDGSRVNLDLVDFSAELDIAVLQATEMMEHIEPFEYNVDFNFEIGHSLCFAGYPETIGYDHTNAPFTYNEGYISSFPVVQVAGGKYEHIQISALNLGGNSGAPLFRNGKNVVIGMVNGYMWRGADNLAMVQPGGQIIQGSLRIPLPVAYATPLKKISETGLI